MSNHKTLLDKLDYQFNDQDLLEKALTHRSVGKRSNNERLEFLGDSILNFVIAAHLFEIFPRAREGELSRMRSYLVKGDRLAEIANAISLGDYLNLGPGELKSGGFRRASILEDAVEALIGAIYLDGGYRNCSQVIHRLYSDQFKNLPDLNDLKDPKTRLQEYLQSKKLPLPEYKVEEITGADHKRVFRVSCNVEGLVEPTFGVANSRRKAEQLSANEALSALQK